MARFELITRIAAPPERCFDLARDIDFHQRAFAHTGERAIAGRTSGLIDLGESVTWEARHLGVNQRLTAQVVAFDRPRHFRDVMVRGAFRSFEHDHWFAEDESADNAGGTVMTDAVAFRSPGGPLGAVVDWAFMTGYLRRLLAGRAAALKHEAEASNFRI